VTDLAEVFRVVTTLCALGGLVATYRMAFIDAPRMPLKTAAILAVAYVVAGIALYIRPYTPNTLGVGIIAFVVIWNILMRRLSSKARDRLAQGSKNP
jgi:hypothetical protein